MRIKRGQETRKKLRKMMKRSSVTQIQKPGFFCDIEFVKIAMVFISYALLITNFVFVSF